MSTSVTMASSSNEPVPVDQIQQNVTAEQWASSE